MAAPTRPAPKMRTFFRIFVLSVLKNLNGVYHFVEQKAKEKPAMQSGFMVWARARPFHVFVPRYDNRLHVPSIRSGYFPKALYPPVATPRVRPKGQAGGVRQKDGASFFGGVLAA